MIPTARTATRFRWIALAIFAIAFGVRVLHVLQIRSAPFFALLMGDSRSYDEWAVRIASGDWIGREVFYQAPLYPYFLGVVYRLVGRDLLFVRVMQAAIGSASCVLLASAVRVLFRPLGSDPGRTEVRPGSDLSTSNGVVCNEDHNMAGAVAGLMLALWAPAIFFDGLIQKSFLDVFFVCVVIWLIARISIAARSTAIWLALGLALGALALTRENALALIVVVLAWALTQERRWRAAATVLAGLAIVLLPVAARNRYVGGDGFYITTAQFGPNLYIGNNSKADGTYASLRYGRGAPEYERQDATELAERASGRLLMPAEVSAYWTDRALDFITSAPRAWLRLTMRKILLLMNRTEAVDTESQETHAEWSWPLRLLGPVTHFGVLVPLAALGVMLMWPPRRPLGVLLALTIVYAASVVIFYVFARYRYPLVPLLIVFAAGGVVEAKRLVTSAAPIDRAGTRALRRPLVLAAILIAVAAFCNWPALSPALMQAVSENNIGVALEDRHRYDEAIAHYRRAIALRPEYPPAYNNLATALRAAGRVDDAVATYGRALELQPDFPDAHYNLANALVDRGRTEEAIQHYHTALRSIPESVDLHTNLGVALAEHGNVDEAMAELRAAISIDPASARAHRNLGDLLASRGDTDEALKHLLLAADLDPSDSAAQYDLGGTLLEAGRPDEAARAFREAIRLRPDFVEAHNNLGIALGSQGRLDEAIAEFRQALRIQPGFADAQRNLATALRARPAITASSRSRR